MTTLRQAHKKNFTCITNSLCQNNELTLRARGLLIYLLSLPYDWEIHVNHLCKTMIEGRDAILTVIKELKKFGYIHQQKVGFQGGWQYFVFESPTTKEEFKEFLRTNGFSVNRLAQLFENPQLQSNKENIQNTDLNTKTPKSPRRGPRSLRAEERKKWMIANEWKWKSPGGYVHIEDDHVAIISGTAPVTKHFYGKRDPFWDKLNL